MELSNLQQQNQEARGGHISCNGGLGRGRTLEIPPYFIAVF